MFLLINGYNSVWRGGAAPYGATAIAHMDGLFNTMSACPPYSYAINGVIAGAGTGLRRTGV